MPEFMDRSVCEYIFITIQLPQACKLGKVLFLSTVQYTCEVRVESNISQLKMGDAQLKFTQSLTS